MTLPFVSRIPRWFALILFFSCLTPMCIGYAQSIALPWSGHGHDPQHTGLSKNVSQPLGRIRWTMPVDLERVYSGTQLWIHYGSPLVTRANTLLVPVKTGADDGFRVEARDPADGAVKWTLASDYSLPSHNWVPSFNLALTPKNRLYFPGLGGTVRFRDSPDSATGASGQLAFYGLANYAANAANFNARVKINTPITADRYGNIFFGFQVTGTTSAPALKSGIARIAEDGTGTWIGASDAANDSAISRVPHNCAPALSNDHGTLYIAVGAGDRTGGYLLALDSRTLAPLSKVRLKDVKIPANDAALYDDGSASPTVGPDDDVYFGVLENPLRSNHFRGWLLHFDKSLAQAKTPGAFGWDDTSSIVPASLVPSYHGSSSYLVLTKFNNYVFGGGDGVNKLALFDPNATMADPITGATVMKEILAIAGPTPDEDFPEYPDAVREWCINTAAVDPFTKSAIAGCEDGIIYRWDFLTNTFSESLQVTDGVGEAYTPSVIGVDGTVYVIADGTLFALGAAAAKP